MSQAAEIVESYRKLKAERSNYDRTWQQIADYMRPIRAEFLSIRQPGERRNNFIFDSTALTSVENFAGGIYGMMTNPANDWFGLRLADDELNDYEPVKDWLYEVKEVIRHSFGPQICRFYAVLPSMYADLACFGTAVFYSEEVPGSGRINDVVRPLSECVIAESAYGDVDTVYRRFSLTGKQAIEQFGDALHPKTSQKAEKEPYCAIWFIHCVKPNGDYDKRSTQPTKRPFISIYVEEEQTHTVARQGYYELPYQVPRWSQAAGEVYGRGIGEIALPDVKMLNRMDETAIKAAQKVADPPLAAPDEGVIKAARTWPGGITYGAMDEQGRQLLKPLFTGGDVGITLEMMQQRRAAVQEAFFFSLMQMVGTPNMTATEWVGRQEEKLRLLGPNLGRIQSEFLDPLIRRRFGLLLRAGRLPPPPQEIQGQTLQVEYVSPLARMQMAGEAQAVTRLYQALGFIAQIDPSVMDNVDNDQAAKVLSRGFAVPAPVERGKDEIKALRAERAQQAQMQQGLGAAALGAKAARDAAGASKDFATANATEGQSGGDVVAALKNAIGPLKQLLKGQK